MESNRRGEQTGLKIESQAHLIFKAKRHCLYNTFVNLKILGMFFARSG